MMQDIFLFVFLFAYVYFVIVVKLYVCVCVCVCFVCVFISWFLLLKYCIFTWHNLANTRNAVPCLCVKRGPFHLFY